jgi:outer membrane murein-binding lipoprotein Lpp
MKQVSKIGIIMFAAAVVATAIVAGCATSAPLQTEASTSGIRAAQEVGAAEVPRASLHLQLAKEELAHAEKLAENDEQEMAKSMLMRAEADAELAVALSREDAEKAECLAAMERVRKLRRDNKFPATESNKP